jgi:hypothetical protein
MSGSHSRRCLGLVLALAACGDLHLGSGHGQSVRTALDAQIRAARDDGDHPAAGRLDARDARNTMARQHSPEPLGQMGSTPPVYGAPLVTAAGMSGAPGGAPAAPGAPGEVLAPIKLDGR